MGRCANESSVYIDNVVVSRARVQPKFCVIDAMCHDKFYRKNYGILCACVNSAYQALPPIFRAPGNEARPTGWSK